MQYLYNNKISADIWEGQTINPSEYFLIPNSQVSENFTNSNKVIADLSSGDLIASTTNDASGHIVSAADALNFLRGIVEKITNYPFASKVLADGRSLFKRVHGAHSTIPFGQTGNIDLVIPYADSKFTGAEIFGVDLKDT